MKKAVFIDRDGVINNESNHYYIYKQDEFIVNDGIIEALKLLSENDYLLIIITNQGGISKGLYAKADVDVIHNSFRETMAEHSVDIAEFYYCPHHSDIEKCLCRKPGSLMIEKAVARFDIDINQSYLIGDSQRDIEAGEKAGLRCFKINANENILPLCKSIVKNQ